jgi:hypothetical protein
MKTLDFFKTEILSQYELLHIRGGDNDPANDEQEDVTYDEPNL